MALSAYLKPRKAEKSHKRPERRIQNQEGSNNKC